jgi:hypothetical protein
MTRMGWWARSDSTNPGKPLKRLQYFFAFWRRGWWMLLMLVIGNITLALCYAGVAWVLRPYVTQPLSLAVAIVLPTIGLLFLGWLFELFASRLPRITRPVDRELVEVPPSP